MTQNSRLVTNLLLWLTILSLPISFSVSAVVGEAEIFGVAGIIRYSWIMLLFVPIGILTLLTAMQLKRTGRDCKKHFVIALICIPFMLIFGSYRFIFQDISYDASILYSIEEKTDLNLPNMIKLASHDYSGYKISYIKIVDSSEAKEFAQEIGVDKRWTTNQNKAILGLLPIEIQTEIMNFDFFVFCDLSTGAYNEFPTSEECEYIFIAYDYEGQRLTILDDCVSMGDAK